MSYEALAIKWRPKSFKEVVGQEHVVTTLQNAIATGKTHHAYLFSGPRGIGKTTIARILAKTVNCNHKYAETEFSRPQKPEPCNQCTSCKAIAAGRSLDVIEMDAASNRGIDEIRELKESVILAPASCEYNIYIIDEAHMLTTEAFNALLKTLEEPPKHVIFILATTERHKIPTTILSRCQNFDFRYLTYSQITSRLKEICDDGNFTVDDDGLSLIAQQSEGCLRDAENILEQLMVLNQQSANADDVGKLLGFGSYHLMEQLIALIIARDSKGCLETLNALAEQGADLTQCLKNLITHFRSLRLLKHNLRDQIHASASKLDDIVQQAANVSKERLEKIITLFMKANSDIKQYGYEQYNLESALINSCMTQDGVPLTEMLDKLTDMQSRMEELLARQKQPITYQPSPGQQEQNKQTNVGKNIQTAGDLLQQHAKPAPERKFRSALAEGLTKHDTAVETLKPKVEDIPKEDSTQFIQESPSDEAQFDAQTNIDEIWLALLNKLEENKKSLLRSHLDAIIPVHFDDGAFTIEFITSAHRNMVDESDQTVIAEYLSEILNTRVRVEMTVSKETPDKEKKLTPEKPQEITWLKLKTDAEQDSEVQLAIDFFGGEVIDVKPL